MGEPAAPSEQTLRQAVPALPKIFGFIVFNTISFQIALGTPLVLMARRWGASAFYLGLITSLVPLLGTLQLYMAPRIEYIGFRRVMLSGWTGRNMTLALTAALPFCVGFLNKSFLLEALFCFMFAFNFLRGLATASWIPWISHLVPPTLRGRYLSVDQLMSNLSSAGIFFVCGWILGDHPTDNRFGAVLIISLLAGWISLYFLKTIESPPRKEGRPTLEPFLVWAQRVWRDRPFRRLIRANLVFALGVGAWETFSTVFMRDDLQVPERIILYIASVKTLGAVASAWGWGILSDRFGSRPVMALSTRVLLVIMVCWFAISVGLFPSSVPVLMGLSIIFQIGLLGFVVSNTRYSMNNAPQKFPVLALTLFSVLAGFGNALAPILWGLFLSAISQLQLHWGPILVDSFSCFFLGMLLLMLATKMLIRRLPDQNATPTHVVLYHMINDYPLRTINAVYKSLFARHRDG